MTEPLAQRIERVGACLNPEKHPISDDDLVRIIGKEQLTDALERWALPQFREGHDDECFEPIMCAVDSVGAITGVYKPIIMGIEGSADCRVFFITRAQLKRICECPD